MTDVHILATAAARKKTSAVATFLRSDLSKVPLLVLTVATEETSDLKLVMRSASCNNLPIKVLGMGRKWKGFWQKIALLREELERHKNNADLMIVYVDGSDSLFTTGAVEIAQKFHKFRAKIVFSAEEFWRYSPSK